MMFPAFRCFQRLWKIWLIYKVIAHGKGSIVLGHTASGENGHCPTCLYLLQRCHMHIMLPCVWFAGTIGLFLSVRKFLKGENGLFLIELFYYCLQNSKKMYFMSQILVQKFWTILHHFCIPVLLASR